MNMKEAVDNLSTWSHYTGLAFKILTEKEDTVTLRIQSQEVKVTSTGADTISVQLVPQEKPEAETGDDEENSESPAPPIVYTDCREFFTHTWLLPIEIPHTPWSITARWVNSLEKADGFTVKLNGWAKLALPTIVIPCNTDSRQNAIGFFRQMFAATQQEREAQAGVFHDALLEIPEFCQQYDFYTQYQDWYQKEGTGMLFGDFKLAVIELGEEFIGKKPKE